MTSLCSHRRGKRKNVQPVLVRQNFSELVSQFLHQHCEFGSALHISDHLLFPHFRDFWRQETNGANHPTLLGQFRVELTEQGYRSSGGKHPHWYGFALQART